MNRFIFYAAVIFTFIASPRTMYAQQVKYEHQDGDFSNIDHIAVDSLGFIWLNQGNRLMRMHGDHREEFTKVFANEKIFRLFNKGNSTFVSGTFGVKKIFTTNHNVAFISILDEENTPEIKNGMLDLKRLDKGYVLLFDNEIMFNDVNSGFFFQLDFKGKSWETFDCGDGIISFSDHGDVYQINFKTGGVVKKQLNMNVNAVVKVGVNKFIVGGEGLFSVAIENKVLTISENFHEDGALITNLSLMKGKSIIATAQNEGLYTVNDVNNKLVLNKLLSYNDPHQADSIPFNNITYLYASPQGDLWALSDKGLTRFSENIFLNASEYFPYDNIRSVVKYNNGALISINQGFYSMTYAGGDLEINKLLVDEETEVMSSTQNGNEIWFGDSKGMLYKFVNDKPQLVADLSSRGLDLFYLQSDKNKNVWVCQAPITNKPFYGITRVSSTGEVTVFDEKYGLGTRVIVVSEAPDGTLFFGGRGEDHFLYTYDSVNNEFQNLSVELPEKPMSYFETHDLAVDDNGVVWLATSNGLFKYYDKKIEKISILGSEIPWEATAIEIHNEKIWFATDVFGLICYIPDSKQFAVLGEKDGLISDRIYYRNLVYDDKDYLWAGSIEGLSVTQSSNSTPKYSTPPILVAINEEVTENSKVFDFAVHDSVKFEFINTYFPEKYLVNTEFSLQDVKNNLIYSNSLKLEADSTVTLPLRLNDKGDFILKFRHKSGGNFFWSDFETIQFTVSDPWYYTWYSYIVYLILLIILIYQIFHQRLKFLGKRVSVQGQEIKIKEQELMSYSKIIAHDFRSSIRGISSVVQMLMMESDKFDEDEKEYMNILKDRASRLYTLMDWAVRFSKLESKIVDKRQVNFNALLKQTIEKLQVPAHFTISLPEVEIQYRGAQDHFSEIFYQLMENSIKYNDKEEGEITVRFLQNEKEVVVYFRDNGSGIDIKDFSDLFKEFHIDSPKKGYNSAGLGLMIVKKIVDLYHGAIEVKSTKGSFTEFVLKFPV